MIHILYILWCCVEMCEIVILLWYLFLLRGDLVNADD